MSVLWVGAALALTPEVDTVPGLTISQRRWQGARWVVAEVDLSQAQVDLIGQRPGAPSPHTLGRTARQLASSGVLVGFATNAGIYMEDRRPLGLHIEAGQQYRELNRGSGHGNFYMKPNGVFALGASGALVVESSQVPLEPPWTLATQSGPLMVQAGQIHPRFQPDSTSRKVRSAVGVRDRDHIVFAVSVDRVRFYDAATFFRDALGCSDALYLDGTVSTWWTPERASTEGDPQGYGGVLVVRSPDP